MDRDQSGQCSVEFLLVIIPLHWSTYLPGGALFNFHKSVTHLFKGTNVSQTASSPPVVSIKGHSKALIRPGVGNLGWVIFF